jgi:hypothetical protein
VAERLDDLRTGLAIVGLEDAAFVEHDPAEVGRVELVQLLVVGDVDPRGADAGGVLDHRGVDAKPRGLALGLGGDGQRGQDQDGLAGVGDDVPRPFKLLQ